MKEEVRPLNTETKNLQDQVASVSCHIGILLNHYTGKLSFIVL